MVPGAMEYVGHADGRTRGRRFDPGKERVIIHDGIGEEGFVDPAVAEIERRSVVQSPASAHCCEKPIVLAIPEAVLYWRDGRRSFGRRRRGLRHGEHQ